MEVRFGNFACSRSPQRRAFAVALLVFGWRLRTYGRPIAQRPESLAPAPAAKSARAPEPQSPTIELPFTPAVSAVIAHEMRRSRRIMAVVILGGMAFFLLFGAAIAFALSSLGISAHLAMIGLHGRGRPRTDKLPVSNQIFWCVSGSEQNSFAIQMDS